MTGSCKPPTSQLAVCMDVYSDMLYSSLSHNSGRLGKGVPEGTGQMCRCTDIPKTNRQATEVNQGAHVSSAAAKVVMYKLIYFNNVAVIYNYFK